MPKKEQDKLKNNDRQFDKYGDYAQSILSCVVYSERCYDELYRRKRYGKKRNFWSIPDEVLGKMVNTYQEVMSNLTLLNAIPNMISYSKEQHKDKDTGQVSLFDDGDGEIELGTQDVAGYSMLNSMLSLYRERKLRFSTMNPEMLLLQKSRWEREYIGVYFSGSPVDFYKHRFNTGNLTDIAHLIDSTAMSKEGIRVAGELKKVRKVTTKNNRDMAILTILDFHPSEGEIECVMFPNIYNKVINSMDEGDNLSAGAIAVIDGKYDMSRGEPQIIVSDLSLVSLMGMF